MPKYEIESGFIIITWFMIQVIRSAPLTNGLNCMGMITELLQCYKYGYEK